VNSFNFSQVTEKKKDTFFDSYKERRLYTTFKDHTRLKLMIRLDKMINVHQ